MRKNKFVLIFVLISYLGYSSSVKTCSSWQDYWNFFGANSCRQNMDCEDEFAGIVTRWGKEVETYEIQTYDGYILTLFRILSDQQNTPPVLLLHNLFMNSEAFIDRGTKSLAHQFAEKGYDVWLLNFRGTKYSKGHIALKAYDSSYWKFSIHELGVYDIAQAINEIKKKNDQKVLLVGFGLGNTAALIYAMVYPKEAQENLSGVVSLSPQGPPMNVNILTKVMFFWLPVMMKHLYLYLYHGEVPATAQNIRATIFCRKSGIWVARFCDAYFMSATGLDFKQQDPETLPVIVALNKDSNSLKTFEHYYQMGKNRKFQMFDHGEDKNLILYGSKNPPEYYLSNITVPQLFFVGKNDKAGDLQDATVLYQHIPSQYQTEFYVIEHDKFGQVDFVQAKDINELLHTHLMNSVTALVPPTPAQ